MSGERSVDRRTFVKYGGTAATAVALAGCGGGGGEEAQEFPVRIAQGNMPSGLDPHDHRETPTDIVMLHAYEGVLTRDPEGNVQESLATGFERVEEGNVGSPFARTSSSTTATTSRRRISPTRSTASSRRTSASPAPSATSSRASRRPRPPTTGAPSTSSRTG